MSENTGMYTYMRILSEFATKQIAFCVNPTLDEHYV